MATSKRILVTGATGAQGGSVASHLIRRGFTVRAMTRNARSEKAWLLASLGAQVVAADMNDPASLRRAMEGCDGVFAVTNFWEAFAAEWEHGKNLVDAAKAVGTGHFVLSSLPSAEAASGGTVPVPHFDIKARIEQRARDAGLPATFIHVAFYFRNFLDYFSLQRQADGSFAFGFPLGDANLSAISVNDVGGIAAPLFARRDEFLGRTVAALAEDKPAAEYAADMSRVLGRKIVYQHIPRETYAAFGFPGAGDLANMFDFLRRWPPYSAADAAASRALFPGLTSFDTWMADNKARFSAMTAATA